MVNDQVRTRLPIKIGLLEILLFELQSLFTNQPYLETLYKTMFALSYYGLFRIGEITKGQHTIKAKDIHIGQNKNKMLFILHTSKTHGKESRPQKVKITANNDQNSIRVKRQRFFCPFQLSREYLAIRSNYSSESDNFFLFHDNSPFKATQVRKTLREVLKSINLDPYLYDCTSFRAGRASDILPLQEI